jgi:hypothetical protein
MTFNVDPRKTTSSKAGISDCIITPLRMEKGFHTSSLTRCPPPLHLGFIKINFDGASRGNPGPTGFGSILRNQAG